MQMEIPETIRTSLYPGQWVTPIDFEDAYFHIPIHTQSGNTYISRSNGQFRALSLCMSTAPMEFMASQTTGGDLFTWHPEQISKDRDQDRQNGKWLTSTDFKNAYFHIPKHTQSREYLCFLIQGQSFQFKPLPFGLATAPMEFTVVVKEVKLMAQHRYKNPPVPRRLVGQGHIPPNQSSACTDRDNLVLGTGLNSKPRQIRTGTKTGLLLSRLSV